jgi:hypothetical protein
MMNSRTPTIHRNHIELRPLYGYGIWRGLRFRIDHSDGENTEEFADDDVPVEHFQMLFQEFGYDIEGEKIIEWLESDASDSGVQVYTEALVKLGKSPEVTRLFLLGKGVCSTRLN